MKSWVRVEIQGSCREAEVSALQKALTPGETFHSLTSLGIYGLPNWAAPSIYAVGNLSERSLGAEEVAVALARLAEVAPSLNVSVHVGGERQSKICVATVVLQEGKVNIAEPEIEEIPEIDEEQLSKHLRQAIMTQFQ